MGGTLSCSSKESEGGKVCAIPLTFSKVRDAT